MGAGTFRICKQDQQQIIMMLQILLFQIRQKIRLDLLIFIRTAAHDLTDCHLAVLNPELLETSYINSWNDLFINESEVPTNSSDKVCRSTPEICASFSAVMRSISVVVGDFKFIVSESSPANRTPAICAGISI